MSVPHILLQTPRTLLRPMYVGDPKAFFELNNDPGVMKYTGDTAFESLDACEQFLRNYNPYQSTGIGRYTVLDSNNAEVLGWCGLKKRPNGEIDLGYRFFKRHWNKGYATETSKVCLKFGFEQLQFETIIAEAAIENTASIHVMHKLGMKLIDNQSCDSLPSVIYAITKDQYLQLYQ